MIIILYYKYVKIENPEDTTSSQKKLCLKLGLKGRVIIAKEGINGTLEGSEENINEYIKQTSSIKEFSDINFKKSETNVVSFPRLSVKCRKEIVALGRPELFPKAGESGGEYISSEKLHAWLEEDRKDIVILDMRNDYECSTGKFDKSISLPIKNFREIPEYSKELQSLKNKTVVAVCTGGIRCEKGTAYIKKEIGFTDVYQLHDGIVTYMNKYPQGHFKGSLYVFDGRIAMRVPGMPAEILGSCELCNKASEKFINCSDPKCHKHFIVCNDCLIKNGGEEKTCCSNVHNTIVI